MGEAGVVLVAILEPNDEFTFPIELPSAQTKFQGFTLMPQPGEIVAPPSRKKGLLESLFGIDAGMSLPKKNITTRDFRKDLDNLEAPKQSTISESTDLKLESSKYVIPVETQENSKIGLRDIESVELDSSQPSPAADTGILGDNPGEVSTADRILLGTAELSLDSSTRESFFGLVNPVKV